MTSLGALLCHWQPLAWSHKQCGKQMGFRLGTVLCNACVCRVPLGKRSTKSHVAGKLCVQLCTDISPDVSVQTAVGIAQGLSCMHLQYSTSDGSALIPEPSTEHASHAIAVKMFPYLPTNAAAEKVFVKGVLMITNQRVMFVVDGHLETNDDTSSVGPSLASPIEAVGAEYVPEHSYPGGTASLISASGVSAFDEESEDDQDDSLIASEDGVDIGLYGIDVAQPSSAAGAAATVVGGLLETSDAEVETFVVNDAIQQNSDELDGFQVSCWWCLHFWSQLPA